MNILAWSPDGEMLTVPGLKIDVILYDKDTAEKLFSLRGDHLQPICLLSWSPNGKYMATSGLDRQILIWDFDKKQDIDRQEINECISYMAWKPHGNALVIIGIMGKYGVWYSTVPSSMKSPTEDIPGLHSKNGNGLGSLSDLNEDSLDNEFMMHNMHLFQIQKSIEEMAAAGHDTISLDDEAFNLETPLDRCILRLIASCCNGDKLVRATGLVKLLSLEKSVRGAIKLVTVLKLPNLAERFNNILEEKLLREIARSTILPHSIDSAHVSALKFVDIIPEEIPPGLPPEKIDIDKYEADSRTNLFSSRGV